MRVIHTSMFFETGDVKGWERHRRERMGFRMAGDDPALMFLTVPGGIIVVGSALGVADALAYGLSKQIKRLFNGKLSRQTG